MTGTQTRQRYLANDPGLHGSSRRVRPADVENIPTQHFQPALPAGTTRGQLQRRIHDGEFRWPQVQVAGDALASVGGDGLDYRAEPLGLALADTVPRMAFADAVVVLDAVKALDLPSLGGWEDHIGSKRLAANWQQALAFADARAESPAESKSRGAVPHPGAHSAVAADEDSHRRRHVSLRLLLGGGWCDRRGRRPHQILRPRNAGRQGTRARSSTRRSCGRMRCAEPAGSWSGGAGGSCRTRKAARPAPAPSGGCRGRPRPESHSAIQITQAEETQFLQRWDIRGGWVRRPPVTPWA